MALRVDPRIDRHCRGPRTGIGRCYIFRRGVWVNCRRLLRLLADRHDVRRRLPDAAISGDDRCLDISCASADYSGWADVQSGDLWGTTASPAKIPARGAMVYRTDPCSSARARGHRARLSQGLRCGLAEAWLCLPTRSIPINQSKIRDGAGSASAAAYRPLAAIRLPAAG